MMNATILLPVAFAMSVSACAQEVRYADIPVFNLFELGIRQDQSVAYDKVAENNIRTSLAHEDGTLAMYSLKQKANPEIAYMIEIYANHQAYQDHLNSAQYHRFLRHSPDIIAAGHKRRIDVLPQFLGDKTVVQNSATLNNLVMVDVKPECIAAFRAVVIPEMVQSLSVEAGVLAMYAVSEKEQTNRWYFYEIYASEAAYQAHRETPHFKEYLQQTAEMTTAKHAISVVPQLLMNRGALAFTAQ